MPDGHIDVTLFNGAVRNSENEHMAKLLQEKNKSTGCLWFMCSHGRNIRDLQISQLRKKFSEEHTLTVNQQLILNKVVPLTEVRDA